MYFSGNFSPKVSIYGANLGPEASPHINQLKSTRKESIEGRPEYGRMGLKASDEERALVDALDSDSWSVLVPLSPLGAGYQETRKTVFSVASGSPITHLVSAMHVCMYVFPCSIFFQKVLFF